MTPLWRCTASDSRPAGPPSGLLCVRLVWCGLYDGAAYLSTSESYLRDLGVVRLIPRAAYSPEITVMKPTCENFSSFRYFFYEKTLKMHSAFLYIYFNGRSFRLARRKLIIGSCFTNYSKTITHQAEIFQGKLSTIVIFIP